MIDDRIKCVDCELHASCGEEGGSCTKGQVAFSVRIRNNIMLAHAEPWLFKAKSEPTTKEPTTEEPTTDLQLTNELIKLFTLNF